MCRKHANLGFLVGWCVRLAAYPLAIAGAYVGLRDLAVLPRLMGFGLLWAPPGALVFTSAVCLTISLLCWYDMPRRLIERKLPWSLLALVLGAGAARVGA